MYDRSLTIFFFFQGSENDKSQDPPQTAIPEPQTEPNLDPEILSALGDTTDETPKFGEKIHTNLAQRWLPILKKGLPKETKDQLFKEYLVPDNCQLLQAPKLNVEIAAAVAESVRIRDKKIESAQQQLGVGVAAINKAMTLLLTNDDKIQAIKYLGDGCRILSDLHYNETKARIKLLTPGLAKPFLNVIQDCERDETLFGNKISDTIKASKVVEKQGLQIKKPNIATNHKSVAASSQPSTSRAQYQGNWTGPSRFSTSRGGRGAVRKPPMTRKPPPAPATRPAGQGKPHAPSHQ